MELQLSVLKNLQKKKDKQQGKMSLINGHEYFVNVKNSV